MKTNSSVATFVAMNTINTITVYEHCDKTIISAVAQYIKYVEQQLSFYQDKSEISLINSAAGKHPVIVSDNVFQLIKKAINISLLPDSQFNVVIGPLSKLWKNHFGLQQLPNEDEISQKLKLINPQNIVLNEKQKSVFLVYEDMSIDLGAIAKGYITDEVIKQLKAEGITKAIIDLGGNVFVMGDSLNSNNGYWKVGIQNPFQPRGNYIGIINAKNQSIVTSGIYERCTVINQKHYHHIINPNTGYPFENDVTSVTIISDHSIDGEILSTLSYTKGIEKGMKFISEHTDSGAIFIDKNRNVYISNHIRPHFKLTNTDYQLIER